MRKYVLTGGPCSGKTTTLNELGKCGYFIVPEAIRIVLKYGIPMRYTPHLRLYLETKIPSDAEAFCERGHPDAIAFLKFDNHEIPDKLIKICESNRYDKVFFLEMLPKYEQKSRYHTHKEAMKIHELIYEVYLEYGYKPIVVPFMSVQERVEYILKKIKWRKKG
jgi:predicted ATPase